ASCSQLDMLEDERVKAAIMMTLCELSTARHHSLPMECSAFAPTQDLGRFTGKHREQSQGSCVDALSRSAQSWSSYSGYLRDVPQLCSTFSKWNDIDLAREIYRNATLLKIKLIRSLNTREENLQTYMRLWDENLKEMRNLQARGEDMLRKVTVNSHESIETLKGSYDASLSSIMATTGDAQQRMEAAFTSAINRLTPIFDDMSKRQIGLLERLSPLLEDALTNKLNEVYAVVHARHLHLDSIANGTIRRWLELQSSFSTTQQTVSQASQAADSIINKISVSSEQMDAIQRQQTRTVHSAALLADSIQDLTQTAASSLNALNETATQIKLELNQPAYHFSGVWWMARRVAEMLFRVDPSALEYLFDNPTIRLAYNLGWFVCYFIKSGAIFAASLIIAVFSSRNFRKASTSQAQAQQQDIKSSVPSSARTDSSTSVSLLAPGPRRSWSSTNLRRWPPRRLSRIPDRLCHSTGF
ncbi:KAR5 family protein, partial [Pleurotus pulmonarius]